MLPTITGKTKLTGLLGSPVQHSISPLMHNESFRLLGLDYVYLCFDVGTDTLKTAVEGLRTLGVTGFNLTMPDKNLMVELVDELSPAASMIGAINTVINENGKLIGHNTDGYGYMQSVKSEGVDLTGKKMTLLGAGGAATALCVQAALDGVASIDIFNRKSPFYTRAEHLIATLNQKTNCKVRLFDIADTAQLNQSIEESAIVTNATSVGMSPNTDACILLDTSVLRPDLIVSDIIYNPRETLLLKLAREKGCKTFNGLYMLLYQGAKAFALWTGEEMPVQEIKMKFFS